MLVLHHLEQSRSQRIIWLLEELEIEYELKTYARGPDRLAPPELREIHPLGKSPVITDGPLTIAESGAIIAYLLKKYGNGRFMPSETDEQQQLDDLYFVHFSEATLMPPLVMKLVFSAVEKNAPFLVRPIATGISSKVSTSFINPNVKKAFALVDATLAKDGGRQWIAGGEHPTAADFMLAFPLEAALAGRGVPEECMTTNIREYVARVHARPAYQRALEKGPKYDYGPREKL